MVAIMRCVFDGRFEFACVHSQTSETCFHSCLRLCIILAVFSQNEEANTERGAGGVSSHELDNPRVKGVCAGV